MILVLLKGVYLMSCHSVPRCTLRLNNSFLQVSGRHTSLHSSVTSHPESSSSLDAIPQGEAISFSPFLSFSRPPPFLFSPFLFLHLSYSLPFSFSPFLILSLSLSSPFSFSPFLILSLSLSSPFSFSPFLVLPLSYSLPFSFSLSLSSPFLFFPFLHSE